MPYCLTGMCIVVGVVGRNPTASFMGAALVIITSHMANTWLYRLWAIATSPFHQGPMFRIGLNLLPAYVLLWLQEGLGKVACTSVPEGVRYEGAGSTMSAKAIGALMDAPGVDRF